MTQAREKWVDDVKVFACVLVALGHFFQSMVNASILPETAVYSWFDRTIYYFHVPLFFLCSGYLHQKKAASGSRMKELGRKAVSLGIPYVVFSIATWLLKEVFSGSVNTRNQGLLHTLLLEPASPYWYLYTLFFIFLVTPRFSGGRSAALGGLCALALKALRMFGLADTGWYPVDSIMEYEIWFVLGMLLRFVPVEKAGPGKMWAGLGSAAGFLAASLWISIGDLRGGLISAAMGLWGCITVLLILRNWNMGSRLRWLADALAGYTMPVFLMHTIFAAGSRAVLLKLGIDQPVIHVVCGIAVSFAGPVVAALIMERLKLDFLLYPGKYMNSAKAKEIQHG